MSRFQVRAIKIDPFRKHFTPIVIPGANLQRAIQRMLKAKQLGWFELCRIEAVRLMGTRQRENGRGTETFDAGPMPLIVAGDALAEEGTPGFRFRGIGKSTAGYGLLFGQGPGGGMVNCPVDAEWLERHLVWLTPEEAEADEPVCKNHPDRPVRETLDGDPLCQECCDAWVRSEGQAAAENADEGGSE